ncbi:MAG: di-heme-cytochrome C peroxidase [Nitrospinaceae bacterium]
MRQSRPVLVLIITLLMFSGCGGYSQIDPALDQGQNWGKASQKAFYQTSQGSQIIRYGWFVALEQPNSTDLFLADQLTRFGYLPDPFSSSADYNPEHLPVGFVRDDDEDEKGAWVGMTCAACHTSELEFKGKTYRIDGGPTDADFFKFISELSESLLKTAKNDAKFARFAARIEGQSESFGTKYNGTDLRVDLKKEAERFKGFVTRSTPDQPWGKARLDAVTLILNEVGYHLVPDKKNLKVPNAPVSYPFLWDTHQQPRVQWNGISSGELSRNTTEVLGVFAKFDPADPSTNTVQLGNLMDLEDLVEQLRSPKWKDFNFIDNISDAERAKRLEAGAVLYKERCQSCHDVNEREEDQVSTVMVVLNPVDDSVEPVRKIGEDLSPINTDPAMAMDFYNRKLIVKQGKEPKTALKALGSVLPKVWLKSFYAFLVGVFQELFGESAEEVRVYKARPLNGVWATAPYLHNGSVPNMMELLKPVDAADPKDRRVDKFCVGSREFDPVNLGFESSLDTNGSCGDNFLFDTTIPGNRNMGHDYDNASLSTDDRLAIIEFIKWE